MTDAEHLVAEGLSCADRGDVIGAERAYRDALARSPTWSVPYYNLGLMCKYQGRWQESLELNKQAALLAPEDEAAWWNLGIAATALGDWAEARRAWKACGMEPPVGDGAPVFDFGSTPVRLDPNGEAEVVWAHRIDPARARIMSVPLPWSKHNYGDVVLTDGAAEGYRVVDGRRYPVFNVLALLSASLLKKYIVELATVDATSVEALVRCAEESGGAAEDWGQSTNILCAKCSLGTPHDHAAGPSVPAHPHCGLAAKDDAHAEAIIQSWLEREPRADLVRWYDAA